ncbi:MAG: undecaprenyl/decaprenyl-phosphate alpha-N-acetylglucosaminyl 1-phosphate transferase [Clostridia bacterium]|nr:undecaprenyl/decaprenyl-phosphate alpha-N-acetylglucosaminyl 1-phosphate transferase [Clostridia bacterium]
MEYIYEYLIAFFVAFIVAFSATPIAKKVAFKIGAVDVPKDNRRMHKKPIARLGGLAIFAGFFISTLFFVLSSILDVTRILIFDKQLLGIMIGAIIIVGIGIIDDVKQLGAKIKLLFQIIAAVIVVLTGTKIGAITNPFSEIGVSSLSDYIAIPLTILWIIGITNAINLIDGLDGLAAGVASISSLSLFFVSVINIANDPRNIVIAIITAAVAGSTLGFLPFNFNPAKIFMGDTGATFLGFILGSISAQGMMKSYAAITIAIPLLALGLPVFDTIFAVFRRLLSGKSIMSADRGHLHHRLIDMGLSHKQSVVVMYTASAALGLCAIVLAEKGILSAIMLVIAISVFVIGGARYMSELDNDMESESEESDEVDINMGIGDANDVKINNQ